MEIIYDYVERMLRDVPDSERKQQLIQEITQNLNEKVQDLIRDGKNEEDAVNKAIVEFGDFDEIKAELRVPGDSRPGSGGFALAFSIWGAGLIIALVVFINMYYTPHVIWFVYPTFGVLWWPLALTFHWLRKRSESKYDRDE